MELDFPGKVELVQEPRRSFVSIYIEENFN